MPRLGDPIIFIKSAEPWSCAGAASSIFQIKLHDRFLLQTGVETDLDEFMQGCVGDRMDDIWYIGAIMEKPNHKLVLIEGNDYDDWYVCNLVTSVWYDSNSDSSLWWGENFDTTDTGEHGIYLNYLRAK